ncbi:MAG TPA: UDP-N-acetylenolpyruvoylglucosamine reductase [Ruminiclostridium sp.]|nr:UDP-N-acetylenolpyruvoylglucosamine reductase [Ruminiclostridium sp.]
MQKAELYSSLKAICGEESLLTGVPMKEFTSMKVGGKADYLAEPDSFDRVRQCIEFLHSNSIPFLVMGNGSNLIFSDEGYSGVVVKIGNKLSKIGVMGNFMEAQAGASVSALAHKAMENSLSGLEFASGIPGSVGGAAYMNAGAYDGEMKQVIVKTLNVDKSGKYISFQGEEHRFSYRRSRIQDEDLICLQVVFQLQSGDQKAIRDKMNELNARRRDKQPLTMPSAGSVFKRPTGQFAGKLIDNCGLRGFSIGGAQVSEKHCGFIVNTGTATAADIVKLIRHIQKVVYEKTGTVLEPEVKIIGGNQECNF